MSKRKALLIGIITVPALGFIALLSFLRYYAGLISESSASDMREARTFGLTEECRVEFEKFKSLLIESTEGTFTKERLRQYTAVVYYLYKEEVGKGSTVLTTEKERLVQGIISLYAFELEAKNRKFAEEIADGLIKTLSVYKLEGNAKLCAWCPTKAARFRFLLIENIEDSFALEKAENLHNLFTVEVVWLTEEDGPEAVASSRQKMIEDLMSTQKVNQKTAENMADGIIKAAYTYHRGEIPKACQPQ